MSIEEKIAAAEKFKADGTVAFKAGDFATAATKYTGGFKYVWDKCATHFLLPMKQLKAASLISPQPIVVPSHLAYCWSSPSLPTQRLQRRRQGHREADQALAGDERCGGVP